MGWCHPHSGWVFPLLPEVFRGVSPRIFFLLLLFFQDKVSLCSPGCPETRSVDQAGLASASLGPRGRAVRLTSQMQD